MTAREREILELVGLGLTDKAIAMQLGLSRKTVETYLQRAFSRLGVRSRAAAAVVWLRAVERDGAPDVLRTDVVVSGEHSALMD